MSGRRCAQFACELKLAVVVQVVLVAEEDHFVLQQRVVDRRDGLGIEIPGQVYAVNAGADIRTQFHHINGFSHDFIAPRDRGEVNRLAGREQNSRPARTMQSVNNLRWSA